MSDKLLIIGPSDRQNFFEEHFIMSFEKGLRKYAKKISYIQANFKLGLIRSPALHEMICRL